MSRMLTFAKAVNEALFQAMSRDERVICYGLGVDDPKGIFGTTLGLKERFGAQRVFDMPTSENAMTGIGIGAALNGIRPVMMHQRLDFFLLALDQLVNNGAKWHYMFGGQASVPITIRLVVGQGWGQGPQHSQSLHAWLCHIPGLKVVMPFSPYDAKALLAASIEDDNPVVFIEHRWLHNTFGHVPEGPCRELLGKARVVRQGGDLTIVASSYMVLEALRCAEVLAAIGVDIEVVDVRTIHPLDTATILESVAKTGRLLVADGGWRNCGFAAEVLAVVTEQAFATLVCAPQRVTLADCPIPTSPVLAVDCYPDRRSMAERVCRMLATDPDFDKLFPPLETPRDVPDKSFTGPF